MFEVRICKEWEALCSDLFMRLILIGAFFRPVLISKGAIFICLDKRSRKRVGKRV